MMWPCNNFWLGIIVGIAIACAYKLGYDYQMGILR